MHLKIISKQSDIFELTASDVGRQKKPSLSAFNFHSPSAVVWGNYGSMDDLDTRSSAGGVKHSKNAPSTPAPTAMSSTPPSNSTLTSGINHIQSYRRNNPFSFPASSASNMKSQNKETKQSLNPLRSIESQKAFQESANRSRWVDCYPKSKEDTSENLSPKNSSRFSKVSANLKEIKRDTQFFQEVPNPICLLARYHGQTVEKKSCLVLRCF